MCMLQEGGAPPAGLGAGGVVSNSNGNQFGSILCHPKPTTSTSESPPLQLQLASSTLGCPMLQLVHYQLLSTRNEVLRCLRVWGGLKRHPFLRSGSAGVPLH